MDNDTPTLTQSHPESEGGVTGWACINSPPPKRHGIHRHATLNVGNFTVEEADSEKISSLCQTIRKFGIDSISFQEHGLNPRMLPKHEQWAERILGRLEYERSKLSFNVNDISTDRRLWGGTGSILHKTCSLRVVEMGDDKTGLARWSWAKIRGIAGRVVQIVSIYVPHANSNHGSVKVATQHLDYLNNDHIDENTLEFFWNCFQREWMNGLMMVSR